jgi:hypothetical protein
MPMRLSRSDQIGEAGQTAVITFFNDLGWGPLPTGKHDLGTDLFVQMRAGDLLDLGMMLGVQVKTGDSWFSRPGEVAGRAAWWFAEESDKHRSYWADHNIPHLLVVQDESRERRHWARLNRTTIESTGQGIKVFVPADQVLDEDAAEEWIALVAGARKLQSFEGASWTFDITQVPESDWARYARSACMKPITRPWITSGAATYAWLPATSMIGLNALRSTSDSSTRTAVRCRTISVSANMFASGISTSLST